MDRLEPGDELGRIAAGAQAGVIEEVAERDDLTDSEKAAVLGGNAVRFFGL